MGTMVPSHGSVSTDRAWCPSQHDNHQFCHVLQFFCVLILQVKGAIHLTHTYQSKHKSLTFATGLGSLYSQWRERCIQKVIIPVSGQTEMLSGRTYVTPREDEIKPFRHVKQYE